MMAATLSPDELALTKAFMAAKGVRRFPEADSGDEFNVLQYLARKGYRAFRMASVSQNRKLHKFVFGGKLHTRAEFMALVDQIRARDGLPAIGRRL